VVAAKETGGNGRKQVATGAAIVVVEVITVVDVDFDAVAGAIAGPCGGRGGGGHGWEDEHEVDLSSIVHVGIAPIDLVLFVFEKGTLKRRYSLPLELSMLFGPTSHSYS
jgi:hypothetical protein